MTSYERTKIKHDLELMKIHLDRLSDWCMQASDMIYRIENKIMDAEDTEINKFLQKMG